MNPASYRPRWVFEIGRRLRRCRISPISAAVSCVTCLVLQAADSSNSRAQEAIKFQERIGGPVRALSTGDIESLTDPFFELVLQKHADSAQTISEIERLLGGRMHTFVVSEMINDPRSSHAPRAVIAFTGDNDGFKLDGRVMLSPLELSRESFPDRQDIEALAWDEEHGVYNYYRLDNTPDGVFAWKFQGSSATMALLDPADQAATCIRCHVNGAPLMKELLRPWGNWNSLDDQITYLRPGHAESWPVASDAKMAGHLAGAERLEGLIIGGINRFNRRRLEAAIEPGAGAAEERVNDPRGILKPLFATTEVNLISSLTRSGLHPIPDDLPEPLPNSFKPQRVVEIPSSFFLNARLIGESEFGSIRGLQLGNSLQFAKKAQIEPDEYRDILTAKGMKLAGSPGTTKFAWFVPEASQIDNHLVETLMARGIVTPQFVAAVLSVDLRTPVFSKPREALMRFLPDAFEYTRLAAGVDPLMENRHPDRLTKAVIANLRSFGSGLSQVERDFLEILQLDDPKAELESQIELYLAEIDRELNGGDPTRRRETLERLFDTAHQRRVQMLRDPIISRVVESHALLPMLP